MVAVRDAKCVLEGARIEAGTVFLHRFLASGPLIFASCPKSDLIRDLIRVAESEKVHYREKYMKCENGAYFCRNAGRGT